MSRDKHHPSQFELFPSSSKKSAEISKPYGSFKSLTLSLENIIVMSIVFVVCVVLFYSFGFERGKQELAKKAGGLEITADLHDDYDIIVQPLVQENSTETVQIIEPEGVKSQKIEVLEIPLDREMVERSFTIQVASFKQKQSAEQEVKTLEKKGHEATVLRKGNYSIVCVGSFAGKQQANAYTAKLKKTYKDLLVRRL